MNSDHIKTLVIEGKTKMALEELLKLTTDNDSLNNKAVSLIAQYNRLKDQELQNTLSSNEINIETNKINATILELLDHQEAQLIEPTNKKIYLWLGILIAAIAIGSSVYFLSKKKDIPTMPSAKQAKVIMGKVMVEEKGEEYPLGDCLVKVTNQLNLSATTDSLGLFRIPISGIGKQPYQLKISHIGYQSQEASYDVNFSPTTDSIFFTNEFILAKEPLTAEQKALYRETLQVVSSLSNQTDTRSTDYQQKIQRFNELYWGELPAFETNEVAKQMVEIGELVKKIQQTTKEEEIRRTQNDMNRLLLGLSKMIGGYD